MYCDLTFRVIKLTSPKLNYVIILGTVLLMVGNLFDPFPSSDLSVVAVFCMVSVFMIFVITMISGS